MRLLGRVHGSVDRDYRRELIERFALAPDRRVRALSHGNRQKLLLIAAFATRAEVLLLDEPTTGLDPLMERLFHDCVREAGRRGQTVLLSSHVLSEVESVCSRIAMLRRGRLVEVARLDRMRALAARRVRCHFPGAVPDLSVVPGVRDVRTNQSWVDCGVTGRMGPLLSAAAAAGADEFTTREPSSEELFLAHYGSDVG